MITREMAFRFKEDYEKNMQQLSEWNERLFAKMSEEAFFALLEERSVAIREIYKSSEEMLKQFNKDIPEELTEEEAIVLHDLVIAMFKNGMDDMFLLINLCERIIPFFEERQDYERMMPILLVLGNEYAVFYRLVHQQDGVEKALNIYRKIISFRDKFHELKSYLSQSCIVVSYVNLLMFLGQFRVEGYRFSDLYRIVEDMENFYEGIRKSEKLLPELVKKYQESRLQIYQELLIASARLDLSEEKEYTIFKNFMKNKMVPACVNGKMDRGTNMVMRIITEKENPEAVSFEYASWLHETSPKLDITVDQVPEKVENFMLFHSYEIFFLDYLARAPLSPKVTKYIVSIFLQDYANFLEKLPYSFMTEMMNSEIAEWYSFAEPFLTERQKEKLLTKFILMRQPITYIHSLMVKRLTAEIAEALIREQPELFIGVCKLSTKEAIARNEKKVLEFVSHSGFLHDCGKCSITGVINRQNRPLTDQEFALIKEHPLLGKELVNNSPFLEPYYDVMMGHHKSYDGKSGYPEEFDNTASPLRFVIDLVSIADSMDAATDLLGRNYAKGKKFETLLEELKEGAGTRYNPQIVAFIDENEKLKERLAYLTSVGRYEIYREAYTAIAN